MPASEVPQLELLNMRDRILIHRSYLLHKFASRPACSHPSYLTVENLKVQVQGACPKLVISTCELDLPG